MKNTSIQVKNAKATLFFRESCSKILNDKKYVFNRAKNFRASANCSKLLNVKSKFNTVKNFRASASCSKILNYKNYFNTGEKFQGNSVFEVKRTLLKIPE